jgi:hypothetical protein
MAFVSTYPPHPAEGRRNILFVGDQLTPAPANWPAAATTTPAAPAPTAATTSAGADRRQHWLAYDPSARSQYPVD